jgi:hypothetical protein
MNNIIGYTHLPYTKKEQWKLKANQFLKKEYFKIPNKKIPLLKTNKNTVYFFSQDNFYHAYFNKKYHFNYFRHCLSQFEENKQFVFISQKDHTFYVEKMLEDMLYYKNKYGSSSYLYIESTYNKPEMPALNFFNDLFDNVSLMDIYHILHNDEKVNINSEILEASKNLLYLLCIELQKIRQLGQNIDQHSITELLKQENLFMLNSHYVEQLNLIHYDKQFSLSFKHQEVVHFLTKHYFSTLFNAQNNKSISNTSSITLLNLLKYGYNFIAINPSFAIQKYLDYCLSKTIYPLNYIQFGDDNLAFVHRQNYNFQHFISIDIKSKDAFFHLIEQVKQGNIELIFSKSNYNSDIFNYVLTEYNISSLDATFRNAHQILFNQQGAFVIHDINLPECNFTTDEIVQFKDKLSYIENEFFIRYEEKYFNNLLSSPNIDLEKVVENKKRKKI